MHLLFLKAAAKCTAKEKEKQPIVAIHQALNEQQHHPMPQTPIITLESKQATPSVRQSIFTTTVWY